MSDVVRQVGRGKASRPPPARVGRWVRLRFGAVAAVLVLLMTGIAWQAYGLQIERVDHFRTLAERQHVTSVEVPAPRGKILDARGRELAATAHVDSVYANPRAVVDVADTADKLAAALGLDVRELEARLSAPRQFVWIERHVSEAEASRVEALGLAGVGLTPEPRRFYPGRTLGGTVLGFAGIDGKGLSGLELTLDRELTGKRESVAGLRDASGAITLSEVALEPRPGASVRLTIDRAIQFTAERALADAIAAHAAKGGVAVVLDVTTGAVLALASAPTLDPNAPGRADPQARNKPITDVFEIGSVMKVFTIAAALDAGAVKPTTRFDTERGKLKVGRKLIRDTHEDGVLTVSEILKRSSNVGTVKIARALGKDGLHAALRRFGFGTRTGIELPGEQSGLLRAPERWGEIGLATVSFGYGLSVTPLQVAAAMAAIGNRGVYHAPYLVEEVRGADGAVLRRHEPAGRRVVSEETARQIWPMMASVFERGKDGGTAGSVEVDGFRAGAKTGTAHKIDPATGRYGEKMYLSSFAGLAPIDAPRIAVVVVIDEPSNGAYFGGKVAGPPWATIVSETLRYLGVPADAPAARGDGEGGARGKDGEGGAAEDEVLPPSARDDNFRGNVEDLSEPAPAIDDGAEAIADAPSDELVELPDFRGMGMAQALAEAQARGVKLIVTGSGRVVSQSPEPGPLAKPAECRVVLAPPRPTSRAPAAPGSHRAP